MIEVSKGKYKFFSKLLTKLEKQGVLSQEIRETLQGSVKPSSFDWKKFAKISFWLSIICFFMGIGAFFQDYFFVLLTSMWLLIFGCAALSGCFYFLSYRARKRSPNRVFMNEALLFFAVIFSSSTLSLVLHQLQLPVPATMMSLVNVLLYGVVGLVFGSKLIWLYALLSSGHFFGIELFYSTGVYGLQINPSLPIFIYGVLLVAGSILGRNYRWIKPLYGATRNVGLLYVFLSLWVLSICGMQRFEPLSFSSITLELCMFSVLFGLASFVAIYLGCKLQENAYTGFGFTFLLINLYTRYAEIFWDRLSFIAFFLILGITFWIIGMKAESFWIRSKKLFTPID